MRASRLLAAASVGYFVGTFPTADLVSRRAAGGPVDLRSAGSGNPGGANAMKVLGTKSGLVVMAGDIVKGAAASGMGALIAGGAGAHIAGTASVVGHCFPVWNGFRGGKGVAASVGQCFATFPGYFGIDVSVAAATTIVPQLKQRAFFATWVCCIAWVLGAVVWWRKRLPNLWGPRPGPGLVLASAASSAIVLYRFSNAEAAAVVVDPIVPLRAA